MISLRKSDDRGHFDHGWLKTYHTFSFDRYYDPKHVHFRDLRVINEDFISPRSEFPTHPHRDMEILTYVLEGELTHRDSMGHEAVLERDGIQAMTAGTGITHSESNKSRSELTHLLQIWIIPERKDLQPVYRDKVITPAEKEGRWRLIVSRDGREDSLTLHQDVSIYASILKEGQALETEIAAGRHAWLQVARGAVLLNGTPMDHGDGAAISDERKIRVEATEDSEILLFDLR